MEYTAAVLRNKGVQVETAVLSPPGEDGAPPDRAHDKDGNVKTQNRWIRFDSNAIADIEEQFGSLAAFEHASRATPFHAIRKALAIVWDVTAREAGLLMLDGKINDYSTAVGVGLSVANGVDPMQALRLLRVGVTAGERIAKERDRLMEETLVEAETEEAEAKVEKDEQGEQDETMTTAPGSVPTDGSTGSGGSNDGSAPAEETTSSGVTPLLRSPSSSDPGSEPRPSSGEAVEQATEQQAEADQAAMEQPGEARLPIRAVSATS